MCNSAEQYFDGHLQEKLASLTEQYLGIHIRHTYIAEQYFDGHLQEKLASLTDHMYVSHHRSDTSYVCVHVSHHPSDT